MMTDSEVIDILGGTGPVAELCRVTAGAVSQWRTDGIPAARRFQLAKELGRLTIDIPPDFFDRSLPIPYAKSGAS